MNSDLMKDLLQDLNEEVLVLGVEPQDSLTGALYLKQLGFKKVFCLKGGFQRTKLAYFQQRRRLATTIY